jgi:hypothetical protein
MGAIRNGPRCAVSLRLCITRLRWPFCPQACWLRGGVAVFLPPRLCMCLCLHCLHGEGGGHALMPGTRALTHLEALIRHPPTPLPTHRQPAAAAPHACQHSNSNSTAQHACYGHDCMHASTQCSANLHPAVSVSHALHGANQSVRIRQGWYVCEQQPVSNSRLR